MDALGRSHSTDHRQRPNFHADTTAIMLPRIDYFRYKDRTHHVTRWLVKSSNAILLRDPHAQGPPPADDPGELQLAVNRTGDTTVNGLIAMARLVSRHVSTPSAVFETLQSAIELRTTYHNSYTTLNPDQAKKNDSHKHFIEALRKVSVYLGGAVKSMTVSAKGEAGGERTDAFFANRFDSLHVQASDSDGEQEVIIEPSLTAPHHRKAKAKLGKKGKIKKRSKQPRPAPPPEDLPLESYKIIQDEEGALADYLMAVLSLIQEWIDLRVFVQNLWQEVAYNGLHSAVAGTLSNMAVTAIKKMESAIWLDFPGHDSYYSILDVITKGDIERAKSTFKFNVSESNDSDGAIDVQEQLLLYAYQDLVDFAVDYQNNRNGKPTKRMQKQLAAWDPSMDLEHASREERISWRRKYTINWLYDLVNVFTDVVVRDPEQQQRLEDIDWSPSGYWSKERRLFGMCDFAGFASFLAMQKPGTDIRPRIRASHVFQLQCIVDSMTAARGWTVDFTQGHVLRSPASGFQATRDIDVFLGRKGDLNGKSFPNTVRFTKRAIQSLVDPDIHRDSLLDMMEITADYFIIWLGRSPFGTEGSLPVPSRFEANDSQGLHEYCPYLCGAGLAESLELSAQMGLHLWDNLLEIVFIIHIHNMLIQKGALHKPIRLYQLLQDMYPVAFFKDGKPPTRNFLNAVVERVNADRRELRVELQRHRQRNNLQLNNMELDKFFNSEKNKFFKTNTLLTACHMADWDLERIPERDMPSESSLMGMIPSDSSGQRQTQRLKLLRLQEDEEPEADHTSDTVRGACDRPVPNRALDPKDHSLPLHALSMQKARMSTRQTLESFKADLIQDVCGARRPLSNVNHGALYCEIARLLQGFERRLAQERHPGYVLVMSKANSRDSRRQALCALALEGSDPRICEIMAEEFRLRDPSLQEYTYWDGVVQEEVEDQDLDLHDQSCIIA